VNRWILKRLKSLMMPWTMMRHRRRLAMKRWQNWLRHRLWQKFGDLMIQNAWFSKLCSAAWFQELSSQSLAMWCLNNFSWLLRNTISGELITKKKSQLIWPGFASTSFLFPLVSSSSSDLDSIVTELLLWDSLSKWDKEFTEVSYRRTLPSSRLKAVTPNS